jgi:signal transduction histidine kinase
VIVALAMGAAEAVLQPSAKDRMALAVIFVLVAAVAVVLALWLPSRRPRSLARAVFAVASAAIGLVALAIVVAARQMFLSVHDLQLVLIVLGFGLALAVVMAYLVTGRMTADLRRLAEVAARVGAGDRTVRAEIDRDDEIGTLAATFDAMVARLAEAEASRDAMESARRSFLAGLSHDLRTPLTSLRATLEALQDGMAADPDRYLASMALDLDDLTGLIDDLFTLTKIEAHRLEMERTPLDVADLIDETVEAMVPVASVRNVQLRFDPTGHCAAVGSERQLRRALRNLLDNAIRHAASHVEVTIERADASIRVTVGDDGPGFPTDVDVFAGGTRGDIARSRDLGGAGLGLAIAKGIVEAHGGRIWVEPRPGGVIGFELPTV